jgi:hypothetical protein
LDDVEILMKLAGTGRYIVFIDELRRFVDSRIAQSTKSRLLSNLFADIPKSKMDLYYTDQWFKAVDVRVRVNVDRVIKPSYNEAYGFNRLMVWNDIRKYEMFETGWEMWNPPCFEFGFYAKPYFKFYNTMQKIDDYLMRFKPKSHAIPYLKYCKNKVLDWGDKDSLVLYCEDLGLKYTTGEKKAILTFIENVPQHEWKKWK